MLSGKSREEKFLYIIELDQHLISIREMDILLERILTETRAVINADAGSIYVVEGDNLRIKYAQNDTRQHLLESGSKLPYLSFSFPIDKTSIAGYVATSKKPINIDDAYNLPNDVPYKFNSATDVATGYKTRSIYTIPLMMASGTLLGVMQLVNAKDSEGNYIPFDEDSVVFINHFAKSTENILENAYLNQIMIQRMLKMAMFRDPKETYSHVERVSILSVEIYDRLAFKKHIPENKANLYRENLKVAAKFHDIGKIGISDLILKKPTRFTDEERALMQDHTCIGASLFVPCESSLDEMSRDVALHHHDWWDGTDVGYTKNRSAQYKYIIGKEFECLPVVKGEEIPLSARIVAVADVFDALSHRRVYKDAWSLDDAFAEIEKLRGKQFDPDVVDAFLEIKDRIIAIQNAYSDTKTVEA